MDCIYKAPFYLHGQRALQCTSQSPTHTHTPIALELLCIVLACPLGLSALRDQFPPQGHVDRTEPPALLLVDDLIYLLSHNHPNKCNYMDFSWAGYGRSLVMQLVVNGC